MTLNNFFIVFYLLISFLWLAIGIIIAYARYGSSGPSALGIIVFIISTIIYLAAALYYSRIGNNKRVEQIAILTLITFIIYIIVECFLSIILII
jgi:hypothetical protein